MKFGVNVLIWTANFTREHLPLLPEIKRRGFDGIEVPIFSLADFCAEEIRRGAEQNGLECTSCSVIPRGLHMGSDDASVRRKTIAHVEDCVKLAADAGAKILDRCTRRLDICRDGGARRMSGNGRWIPISRLGLCSSDTALRSPSNR